MEPSVQKFIRDYHQRVAEPDGPPHVFGSLPVKADPVAATDLQNKLDAAAKGAQGVQNTLGTPPAGGVQ
jgi:hypothetical protein